MIADLGGVGRFLARRALDFPSTPVAALDLEITIEPTPDPDSRVTLGEQTDALGQRLVVLDWRVSPQDRQNGRAIMRLLGAEAGRTGLGRLHSLLDEDDTAWPPGMYGDQHHMGTTRMDNDPAQGVVDANCRMHQVHNLYVAGSSVFPRAGVANPTLTITALALRLGQHLKAQLA